MHVFFHGEFEFVARFVVAVKINFLCGHFAFERGIKLAARNDVRSQTFAVHYAVYGESGERFRGIKYAGISVPRIEEFFVSAANGAYVLFVHNVQRRAVFFGKGNAIRPAYGKVSLFVNFERVAIFHFNPRIRIEQ